MFGAARSAPFEHKAEARICAAGVTPRRGSTVVCLFRLRSAFRLSAFRHRGDGECSEILCGGPVVPYVGARCRASALVLECWSVIVSRANGEGVFGMVNQSSYRIRLHLGAMGRSHRGVDLMPLLSSGQFSWSVEAKSAQRFVRATMSGCATGVRLF